MRRLFCGSLVAVVIVMIGLAFLWPLLLPVSKIVPVPEVKAGPALAGPSLVVSEVLEIQPNKWIFRGYYELPALAVNTVGAFDIKILCWDPEDKSENGTMITAQCTPDINAQTGTWTIPGYDVPFCGIFNAAYAIVIHHPNAADDVYPIYEETVGPSPFIRGADTTWYNGYFGTLQGTIGETDVTSVIWRNQAVNFDRIYFGVRTDGTVTDLRLTITTVGYGAVIEQDFQIAANTSSFTNQVTIINCPAVTTLRVRFKTKRNGGGWTNVTPDVLVSVNELSGYAPMPQFDN